MNVVDMLNSYSGSGDNIWQDVILDLPGYDEAATEAIDPSGASDRFVADGVIYAYDAASRAWYVAS